MPLMILFFFSLAVLKNFLTHTIQYLFQNYISASSLQLLGSNLNSLKNIFFTRLYMFLIYNYSTRVLIGH